MGPAILQIKQLRTRFHTSEGILPAVDGVTLSVSPGKVLGLVGESGSGKTVTALSVMRLIPDPPGRITGGEIIFENRNLLELSDEEIRGVRGRKISMIFQEPMTSLNPVFTVGNQISEMLTLHLKMTRRDALDRTIELLDRVGIPSASRRVREYPHQLSGGMRQRVMIAMAISCNPQIIFADEPTTALDVTIQAQILFLLGKLREQLGMAMVLISHDLGVIAETAQEVAIMYAGKIVETGSTGTIYSRPAHPYTQGLLASIPKFDDSGKRKGRLTTIPGTVPKLSELPRGCKFAPRCGAVIEHCLSEDPPLNEIEPGHAARCWVAFGEKS